MCYFKIFTKPEES